jgi:flagellar biosynthesis/type III secretory pathway protein FliH
MTTTTIGEAYFLIRAGMWTADDLEDLIQTHVDDTAQQHYDDGFKSGYEEGLEDGQSNMYKQALDAIKCLA